MADAICRWRNPFEDTVEYLIKLLPKIELSKIEARKIVTSSSTNFYKTPYQLACQLGLYYEKGMYYYPKFSYIPSKKELNNYLENWIIHYTVPNPYTKSLAKNLKPFSIHSKICEELIEKQTSLDWETTIQYIFGTELGNRDILRNSFGYSPVFEISKNSTKDYTIKLKNGINYSDLKKYIDIDILTQRENKEYFFDMFNIESNKNILSQYLVTSTSEEEYKIIEEISHSSQFTQTEKVQQVKARIGQGYFRRTLINESPFCPITGVDDVNLLIASHIKPWRVSNNQERVDYKNGFLLTPTFDKLFDYGYISFSHKKSLILSPKLSSENIKRLNISDDMNIESLPLKGREKYLEYHQEYIFKD